VNQRDVAGLEHLALITALLHRIRLADPDGGLWEAADFQWWWRRDQHVDPANARYWFDDDGEPVAAVVFTDWSERWGLDVVALPGEDPDPLWSHALHRVHALDPKPIELEVHADDEATALTLAAAWFEPGDTAYMTCWMGADERAAPRPIAEGYRLVPRTERLNEPHHMIARSGPHVAERLMECSLYRPELDLCVLADDGTVAGYGLFWADPVTGVGLVEPMRTEDAHQGKGLGAHLLTSGLDLLARHGSTRLKVTYEETNTAAKLLYTHAGFHPHTPTVTYRHP
jgi:GNAT superfamily N-acetyltransferase